MKNVIGTVYLLHFERPLHHAQHYIGWADNLEARLEKHRKGNGSKLMSAVAREGISWKVVATWEGDRNLERRLKNQKNATRLCPICKGHHITKQRKIEK